MAVTRRQLITGLSALYLTALTTLAAYALYSSNIYSLPIANIVCALAVALPPLAGVALETVISLNNNLAAKKGGLQTSRAFQIIIGAFLVYETVVATLAGIHMSPPGSLNCALRETWLSLFRAKDTRSIERIQERFSCCGFLSPRDMAFPFPDATHGSDACLVRYERRGACVEPWRREEQKVAIMLLVVPLAVFVWKMIIVLSSSSSTAWLPSAIRLPGENGSTSNSRARPAIAYRDGQDPERDTLRDEVDALNQDSNLATRVEGGRAKPGALRQGNNGVWDEGEAGA